MALLTALQISLVEGNTTYQNKIRIAGLNKAAYEKGLPPDATEQWFRNRQTAEILLANPNVSIDRGYWAAKSLGELKNMDIANITGESTADDIAAAITDQQYTILGETVYASETKKVLY